MPSADTLIREDVEIEVREREEDPCQRRTRNCTAVALFRVFFRPWHGNPMWDACRCGAPHSILLCLEHTDYALAHPQGHEGLPGKWTGWACIHCHGTTEVFRKERIK